MLKDRVAVGRRVVVIGGHGAASGYDRLAGWVRRTSPSIIDVAPNR